AELVERGQRPSTIGPYPSGPTCESARLAQFGDLGRCHCTQGFASRPAAGASGRTDGSSYPGSDGDQGQSGPPLP
ncbi:MAG: hypothetical protein ACM3ST_07895, partial [Bdellovibrio bacteriovorus]